MKTVDQFIKELQNLTEDLRKLPVMVPCPNGKLTYPSIKMNWENLDFGNLYESCKKQTRQLVLSWK